MDTHDTKSDNRRGAGSAGRHGGWLVLIAMMLLTACETEPIQPDPVYCAFDDQGRKLIRTESTGPYTVILKRDFDPQYDTLYSGTGRFDTLASDVLDGQSDLVMLGRQDSAYWMRLTLGCEVVKGTYRLTIYKAKP